MPSTAASAFVGAADCAVGRYVHCRRPRAPRRDSFRGTVDAASAARPGCNHDRQPRHVAVSSYSMLRSLNAEAFTVRVNHRQQSFAINQDIAEVAATIKYSYTVE